jgi:enolase
VTSTTIRTVRAWEALDSRGQPTVAVRVELEGGAHGQAIAPAGASTGAGEARELRDGDERYAGKGAHRAVSHAAGELAGAIAGIDARRQESVDAALRAADGTPSLGRLGANATVAISIATAVAAARALDLPLHRMLSGGAPPLLPLPMVNIISGGAHAAGGIDVQDLLVVPVGATSFAEAIEWAGRVRAATAMVAVEQGLPAGLVADEGGLGPPLRSTSSALELLVRGIERSGLRPGEQVTIAVDVAATQLVVAGGGYRLANEDRDLSAAELVDELAGWCAAFPIASIEDPLGDQDWAGWRRATERLGRGRQILGDDLLVTDPTRLARAIGDGVANAVLVKPNQVGTLSQAARVVREAQAAGYATVVSARSGDTEESWLADLAVGWRAGQIKVGSTMRSERTAKWNRLLEIEATEPDASYVGGAAIATLGS